LVAKVDVVAVVAEKWRTDHGAGAGMGEMSGQQHMPLGGRRCHRRIEARKPELVGGGIRLQLAIAGAVQLAAQHFLFFCLVQPIVPSLGNASGAAARAARALALSSSIWRINASMVSNFSSSRMKPMKATSSTVP